jgi:hypothetical protein
VGDFLLFVHVKRRSVRVDFNKGCRVNEGLELGIEFFCGLCHCFSQKDVEQG